MSHSSTTYLIATEATARHLIALHQAGLSYAEIVKQEQIPLPPHLLKMRVGYWRRKLHGGARPATMSRSCRALPPQRVTEDATAYHQRVTALGLALCHCCHHQLDAGYGYLFCDAKLCQGIVTRLREQTATSQEQLCGCPEVVAFLAKEQAVVPAQKGGA